MELSTIPACPSLMCSFNRGSTEGTNSLKICVWCLCMYVLCLQSVCGWYIREKSLEMCICLWLEFDCPEVTLCGSQDIKIWLLLLLLLFPCTTLGHGVPWVAVMVCVERATFCCSNRELMAARRRSRSCFSLCGSSACKVSFSRAGFAQESSLARFLFALLEQNACLIAYAVLKHVVCRYFTFHPLCMLNRCP